MSDSLNAALASTYRIERELGAGGMATVYLAEDLRHRRKVAIKVLHPELSAVIGSERFLKEIELTANLQHPHILPLFDSGDVNGQLYYVMPFVDGETLRSRLEREQQLPVVDAIRIAREVADALAYAHKRGVVHRDIKPENVLLQDGHALVADFGIALAVQQAGAGRMTQTGLSLGTPQYMSPEQAMGERAIDLRSDIYALGAVTYEMLAGEPPFTGPTAQAIIARAMTERPRDLLTVRETLPVAVSNAVMTALAKLPADRHASAAEFASALVLDSATAMRSSAIPSVPNSRARTRWIQLATLGTGLLIGALAMRASRGGAAAGEANGDAPRFWTMTLPDSAPFVTGRDAYDAHVRSLDISPDGERIVWASRRDSTSELWQMRTDLGTASRISATDGAARVTFSPDGKSLAFANGSEITRVDLATNTTSRVGTFSGDGNAGVAGGISWPTAERVVVWNFYGCLQSIAPAGGQFARIGNKAPCGFSAVAPGPSPKLLLVSNGSIGLLDVSTGRMRPVTATGTNDTTEQGFVAGYSPMLLGDALVFMRDSTLYGVRIDVDNARVRTEPRQLLTGVRREAVHGVGQVALSRSGTLIWASGGDAGVSRFVFARPTDRSVDTVATPAATVNSFALSRDGTRLAYTVSLPGGRSDLHVFDLRRGVDDVSRLPVDIRVRDWVDADSAVFAVQVDSVGAGLVIRGLGGAVRLDTVKYWYASSPDGTLQCTGRGKVWPASAPRDSIALGWHHDWCRFSPDAKYVSWVEKDGLMIAPATANGALLRRRIGPPGADEPRWTADGREVMYRVADRWYAVLANPRPGAPQPTPRLVFQGNYNQAFASWDLAPDGRLLLLQGPPAAPATHLNVITSFPRYVEEKLRASAP